MGKASGSPSKSSDNESDEKKLIRRAGINLKIAVTNEEEEFRKKLYPDVSKIKNDNLKCTVCSKTLVSAIFAKGRLFRHTVLDVLVCEECLQFYGDGDFSTDEDGDDKYCRWCGQGGRLYCCSKCTCVFCKKCVKHNLKRGEVDNLEKEDWKCFVCEPKPLFPLRAECWAVGKHLQNEEHKKAKATSRRESSKRKHSTSSEEMPSKTKKKDEGLDSKKRKLRRRQSSDDSNDTDKRRKRRPKEDSGDSNSTDKISAKYEKLKKKTSGAVNRAKSPKREISPASVKPKTNVNKENHVSSKKSAVLVNSNNSSETKRSKKDKRCDSVDSSDGCKSKHSVKSSHSRDSSVCSESKKTKKQIKLACEFLLTTVKNVQQLGEVMANRVKTFEQKITQNTLKTQDDVMKTINKLSKMLIGVQKNVGFIQDALEQNVKTWAAVMDVSNTADLSSLIFNKLEVTNEDQGMDVDELVEGSAAASENLKDTVVDEKGEDSAMQDDKADENEFPSNLDLEHVINDVIQTVTKSIEDEIGNERTGTEIDNIKDTTNENGVLTENEDESRKLDDTAETDKYEAKSSEETVKEIEANENKVSENEVSDERFDKDTAEMTNDKGNCSAVDYNMESTLNESKDADKVVQNEESTTDLSSTFGNEINETSDKVTEEDVSKGVNEEEITKILCEESEDQNKCDENIVNKENEKSNENVSDRTDGSLEPDSLEHSFTNTNEIEGEKNENLDDKESGDVSCSLEDDNAVLAELLNDSSNDNGSGSDDKKQPESSTSSEDLLLSLSSDEDRKSRRKKKRRERKQKTDRKRKPKETVEDEEEKDDEEGEKSENGEEEENEEIKDGTKQDTDSDAEITRLTDLSKLSQKRKKVYTSSEEEDESNQDSDDDLEKGKRAVAKKKKRETQKDKQGKEGLLDFLGNSDEEAVDNDACEGLLE